MSALLPADKAVFDPDVFPRTQLNPERIDEFADLIRDEKELPPILLHAETLTIIDGAHRWHAHMRVGSDEVLVDLADIPERLSGIPEEVALPLWAAGIAAKEGMPLTRREKQEITVNTVKQHPDIPPSVIGESLGVPSSTMSRWTTELTQGRKKLRRIQAAVLTRAGWTQQRTADALGVDRTSIVRFSQMENLHNDLDLIAPAIDALPDGLGEDDQIKAAGQAIAAEAQDAIDHAAAVKRTVDRVRRVFDLWPAITGAVDPYTRDGLLAELTAEETEWLLTLERQIHD